MTTFNLNMKDDAGKQRFIAPIIELVNGKNRVQINHDGAALAIGYVVKCLVEGSGYANVTVLDSAAALATNAKTWTKTATLKLYMPTLASNRDSNDLSKWTLCHEMSVDSFVKTLDAILKIADIANDNNAKSTVKVVAEQPVYFKEVAGASAKKSAGKISITI